MGLISPRGENLLYFLELGQVLSRLINSNNWNFQRVLHTLAATQEVPRHNRLHLRGSTRVPATSRGATFPPPSLRGGILSLRGRERIPVIPVASQEEALSTGKARRTPESCHHSQSPPGVSVHSRETCFPCTASTFKPRIDSHHCDTWESPEGKPRGKLRGKALRKSLRSLDPREEKRDTAATAREESARACPHSRRGLTPLGRLQNTPRSVSALERNAQVPAPTPHKLLRPGIDVMGMPRAPEQLAWGLAFPDATTAGP